MSTIASAFQFEKIIERRESVLAVAAQKCASTNRPQYYVCLFFGGTPKKADAYQ